MAKPKITVYQDAGGEWRWRLQAGNNRIVADSSEGYTRRCDARYAVYRVAKMFISHPRLEIEQ